MDKLAFAQLFVKMGIAVIPLRHRGKEPASNLMGGTWELYKTTMATEYQVSNWLFSGWQNYGVVAGWNNLVVIDFDDMEYFNIWALWMSMQHEVIRYIFYASFKVKTSRGMHVYVSTLEPAENGKRIKKNGGIDIQAQGKFVVGPGCIHPSGHIYEPITNDIIFPCVLGGIETILPFDLFPSIISKPETGAMPIVPFVPISTEYDPFQAASGNVQGFDLIQKVKSLMRIETLFSDTQKTSNDGRWLSCRCVFHDDHKPSMWIDVKRQLCGCSVCNMLPMDCIDLFARMHNLNTSMAVVALAKEIGVLG